MESPLSIATLIGEYAFIGLMGLSILAGLMIGVVGAINKPYVPQAH